MEVCCGTYSYCRRQKGNRPANDLPALEALQRIAASPAHYNDVYLGGTEISQLIGAEFGSEEVELRRVQAARRRIEAMGLRVRATLIGSKVEPLGAALAQGRRRVEQAAALGLRIIIDFGPSGDGTEQEVLHKYIDYMKQLAPHAQSHGIGISMKPHGTLLTNAALIEVHKAVDHPGFGICMDPGNVLFYTKVRRSRAAQELDDLQLEAAELNDLQELAPRVTCVVMKDCALNPSSPQTQDCTRTSLLLLLPAAAL
jgi:sugar phosphate isomerase/epimerase